MIVVGETGSGKSSFCNVIIGKEHDDSAFPVSKTEKSATHKTTVVSQYFKGDHRCPIRVIDTMGFNDDGRINCDQLRRDDDEIKAELLAKLGEIDCVHLFIICVNASNPHIPPSLVKMIHIFLEIYGFKVENGKKVEDSAAFWKRCVVNLTRFSNSEADDKKRKKNGQTKDNLKKIIKEKFELDFKLKLHGLVHLEYFCIDSLYTEQDPSECKMFNAETDRLYSVLLRNSAARNFANYQKDQENKYLKATLKRLQNGNTNSGNNSSGKHNSKNDYNKRIDIFHI